MPRLFETTSIQSLELANRAIRSATWCGLADGRGYVTDPGLIHYGTLAEGNIGLIVGGYQYVMTNGNRLPYTVGNCCEDHTDGLTRLAALVHKKGGKIVPQLVHAGSRANAKLFRPEDELWGPSAIPDPVSGRVPREMGHDEIWQLIHAYAAAAERCKRAGFDGIQLNAGHGYAINQFLSPFWNRRRDAYGGDLSGRYRFLATLIEAVRGTVGEDFPVLIKLNGHDYLDGGLLPEEMVQIARRLADAGVAAIEVSGGSAASSNGMGPVRTDIRPGENEAYFAHLSQILKESVNVPIVTVGGIRSLETIQSILSGRKADYVAMCRPFICEPHLIRRWQHEDKTPSRCLSCNGCFDTGMKGMGISCKGALKQEGIRVSCGG
jgi:2,4-dienoyl-CoA reductase-like NADH-dependent reductase (Old Yellow Enzyme family)